MRPSVALAALLLIGACAPTPTGLTPSSGSTLPGTPSSSVSAVPSPFRFPGSAVRITVNGAEYTAGSELQIDRYAPTVVDLAFPFAVDRASLEQWLPTRVSAAWVTDEVVRLTVAQSEASPAFKIAEVRSRDGARVIEFFVVGLAYAPSFAVSTYRPAELLAGAATPRDGAPRVDARRRTPAAVSPDATKVLLYEAPGVVAGAGTRIVDLASGTATALAVPSGVGPFVSAGWAGARLVLVGREIWVGDASGAGLRRVADARDAFGEAPLAAVPSPLGTFVALGWSAHVDLVDVRDGSRRELARDVRACVEGRRPDLAWARDERLIAWADCGTLASPAPARVRIAEVPGGHIVRAIAGGALGLAAALTGDLLLADDSGETGQGSRLLWAVYGFDGTAKGRHLGLGPALSPDGRYLLDRSCCAGEGFTLSDLRTPGAEPKSFGGSASWLPDGRVLVLNH